MASDDGSGVGSAGEPDGHGPDRDAGADADDGPDVGAAGSDLADGGDAGADAENRGRSRLELFGVLLIALTAVVTSWSAFEASKWGAEMSINFNAAGSARTESVRASNDANNEFALDVGLFGEYANAINRGDEEFAEFIAARFPERLTVAVEAWMATEPLISPDAPGSPFEMEEYVLESYVESDRLAQRADERTAVALEASDVSDDYMITSVMFAMVILFAALSSKLTEYRHQQMMLGVAAVLFVLSAAVLASFPSIL